MATWCISDIHGRYSDTMRLFEKAGISDNDHVYVIGDIVDRGPETRRCLRWAMSKPKGFTFLLGNHEDMLASFLTCSWYNDYSWNTLYDHPWTYNTSAPESTELLNMVCFMEHERLRGWYLDEVLPWISSLPLFAQAKVISYGTERIFTMVHAGLELPGHRLWSDGIDDFPGARTDVVNIPGFGEQQAQKLLWLRGEYLVSGHMPDTDIVTGHTPMMERNVTQIKQFAKAEGIPCDMNIGTVSHLGRKHLIDCGSCYRNKYHRLDMGILRLEDLTSFHLKKDGPRQPPDKYMDWWQSKA